MSLITIPNSNLLTLKLNLLKKRLSILNLVVSLQSEEQKHLFYKIDFIHSCKNPKDLIFVDTHGRRDLEAIRIFISRMLLKISQIQ